MIDVILVSACLLGINCKYNGDNNKNEKVAEYLKDKQMIMSDMVLEVDSSFFIRLEKTTFLDK